jgi:predicted nucleotidyltransferase
MNPCWAVTPERIEAAIQEIVKIGRPRKVILFGSAVRGETNVHSDLDVLVVTHDEIQSPRKESVRIRRALRGISMPLDILVILEDQLREVADEPGLIYREVLRHGKVVYESSG